MKPLRLKGDRIRYYALLLTISLLSMAASTGTVYFFVRNNLINRSVQDMAAGLRSVMQSHVSIFERADTVLGTLAVDNDFTGLLAAVDAGAYTQSYQTYQHLEATARQYDFIDYVSIYYLSRQRVVATRWGLSAIETYQREEIPPLQHLGSDRILKIDVLHEKTDAQGHSTLRIGRYFPIGYLTEPKTYISLTLSSSYLMQFHNRMTPMPGDFYLVDCQENLIYSSFPVPPELIDSAAMAGASPDEGLSISQVEIGGEEQLLIRLPSPGYGLVYSYMLPMRSVTADANFLIRILAFLCIGIILVPCTAGIFSLRRLLRPIDRIQNVVGQYGSGGQPPLPLSELAQHIQRVYDENQSMQALAEKYRQHQKDQFLWRLLTRPIQGGALMEQLAHFGLSFPAGGYLCVLLLSADGKREDEEGAQELSILSMIQALRENLPESIQMESTGHGENDYYLILCGEERMDREFLQGEVRRSVLAAHALIGGQASVTVGVSGLQSAPSCLPLCRRQAEEARDLRWLHGLGQAIFHEESSAQGQESSYPYEIEDRLFAALKGNQPEQAYGCLAQFHQYVLRSPVKDIGQHAFLQLLSATYRVIYDWCSFCLQALPTERECFAQFIHEQTADQLYERLLEIYRIIFAQLERRRSERYSSLSLQIRTYIGAHFQSDLSQDSIADALCISSSHLRRVFREETGMSVKCYIDRVRIEKARELLSATSLTVGEIAAQTGYVSAQTFSRVFKKETGHTPGEYRRLRYGG